MNTFIRGDSKPFSLTHDWKVLLLDAYDRLLAETDDAFEILTIECCISCITESKEPLNSLLLVFALSGWLTARNFCLGLLQKCCFILGWLALRFCCDIIFWKYPRKKLMYKIWNKLGLLKTFETVEKTWLAKSTRLSGIQNVNYYVTSALF